MLAEHLKNGHDAVLLSIHLCQPRLQRPRVVLAVDEPLLLYCQVILQEETMLSLIKCALLIDSCKASNGYYSATQQQLIVCLTLLLLPDVKHWQQHLETEQQFCRWHGASTEEVPRHPVVRVLRLQAQHTTVDGCHKLNLAGHDLDAPKFELQPSPRL
jgi:hypothetical protein